KREPQAGNYVNYHDKNAASLQCTAPAVKPTKKRKPEPMTSDTVTSSKKPRLIEPQAPQALPVSVVQQPRYWRTYDKSCGRCLLPNARRTHWFTHLEEDRKDLEKNVKTYDSPICYIKSKEEHELVESLALYCLTCGKKGWGRTDSLKRHVERTHAELRVIEQKQKQEAAALNQRKEKVMNANDVQEVEDPLVEWRRNVFASEWKRYDAMIKGYSFLVEDLGYRD
ncbi:hypothetical protein M422DRAFT_48662, partial [Sphaerobolus stellatus SS14]